MNEIERAIETVKNYIKALDQKIKNGEAGVAVGWDMWVDRMQDLETTLRILTAELTRQENAPLTIDEIISMNGKPVWCQTGDGYEGWALVIVDNYQDGRHYLYLFSDDLTRDGINEAFEPDEDFYNLTFKDDPNGHFGLHVLGWRAYRYEPEGANQ